MNEPAELKALARPVEIKNEATGEVEAIIATIGVVDRDGDVIQKDAIKSGTKVKMSAYGHDIVGFMAAGAIPVGKGRVTVEGDEAVFRGRVFQSTERGRETLSVLKEMGTDQEWSFGYRVTGSEVPDEAWRKKGAQRILTELDLFEVSPVLIGAGVGTRTVTAKECESCRQHAPRPKGSQAELAAGFAAISERYASPAGVPLPGRFAPVVEFARAKFALYPSEQPTIKVVAAGSIRAGGVGCYVVDRNEILIAAGLDDDEVYRTLFHEFCHVYEARKGWLPDEVFAAGQEHRLFAQWSREWREWTS